MGRKKATGLERGEGTVFIIDAKSVKWHEYARSRRKAQKKEATICRFFFAGMFSLLGRNAC